MSAAVGDTDADEIDRSSLATRIATIFGQAAAATGAPPAAATGEPATAPDLVAVLREKLGADLQRVSGFRRAARRCHSHGHGRLAPEHRGSRRAPCGCRAHDGSARSAFPLHRCGGHLRGASDCRNGRGSGARRLPNPPTGRRAQARGGAGPGRREPFRRSAGGSPATLWRSVAGRSATAEIPATTWRGSSRPSMASSLRLITRVICSRA